MKNARPLPAMPPLRSGDSAMPGSLRGLAPFAQLSAEQLIVAAGRTALRRFRDGERVLARGADDAVDYYLIDGTVAITEDDGHARLVTSGTPAAATALAPTRPCRYEVRAVGAVVCASMARADVAILRHEEERSPPMLCAEAASAPAAARACLADLESALAAGQLKLPSLPALTLRLRTAVADPACDCRRVADLLAADPAVAAKILKIANSPLCRSDTAITGLREAVSRIGLCTISELVVCFSLKDLFAVEAPALRERFTTTVGESVRIGAAAAVIAARLPAAPADQALVAGLLSNIGALAVLDRLAACPEPAFTSADLEQALTHYAPRIGRLMCRHWQLGDLLEAVVVHGGDWSFAGTGATTLADIVICARYHMLLAGGARDLPKAESVTALRILGEPRDPGISVDIIRATRARIQALLAVLA